MSHSKKSIELWFDPNDKVGWYEVDLERSALTHRWWARLGDGPWRDLTDDPDFWDASAQAHFDLDDYEEPVK